MMKLNCITWLYTQKKNVSKPKSNALANLIFVVSVQVILVLLRFNLVRSAKQVVGCF